MADDPVAQYLRTLNISDQVRAAAWNAAYADDDADAEQQMRKLPKYLAPQVLEDLWNLRTGGTLTGEVKPFTTARPEAFMPTESRPALNVMGQPTTVPPDIAAELDQYEAIRAGRQPQPGGDVLLQNLQPVVGAAKGLGRRAVALGRVMHQVPGVSTLFGEIPETAEATLGLEPTNPAQRFGMGAEEIGEYFVPGVAAERAAIGTVARLAPYVAGSSRFVRGATQVVPHMVFQGTAAAGTAALQGHDPTAAGVTAAALPVGGAVAPRVAAALRARSEAFVRAAIKPTVTALRRISGGGGLDAKAHALVRFIIDNRLTTADKARDLFQEAERELTRLLSARNVPTDAAIRAQNYLDALERSAAKQGLAADDVALINRAAAELLEGPMGHDVVKMVPTPLIGANGQPMVGANGQPIIMLRPHLSRELRPTVPAQEALKSARTSSRWSTRKQWGEQKGASIEAAKAVERAQRDAVKAAVPEARPLLRTEAQALSAEEILDRMAQRAANRDIVSLPAHMIAAGEIARGRVPIVAWVANWLRNNQLPAGIWADRLAKAIGRQDVAEVSTILGRLGVGVSAQTASPAAMPSRP